MSNKCPYCGSDDIYVGIGCDDKWGAFCNSCAADSDYNSRKATPSEAVDAFCNPAHLLDKTGLIHLAPDEVVVKRATAETAYSWVRGFVGSGGMTKDDYEAAADLTAALEREVGK